MSRHSRTQGGDTSFAIVILVGAAAWTYREQIVQIAYLALVIIGGLVQQQK